MISMPADTLCTLSVSWHAKDWWSHYAIDSFGGTKHGLFIAKNIPESAGQL